MITSSRATGGLAILALAAAVMMLALAGCPPKTEAPESTPPVVGPKAPAAPAAPQLKGSLTVKGSDTMVNLVGQWAEAFQKEQPGVQVSVNGGGSGTGVAALINGTTDIASSSRDLKDDEKQKAQAKSLTPTQFTVARDAVSIVVNPANPLTEITMEQLAKIYTGATTNWKQLGGPDQKIIVLSRESSSGTYAFFQEHVMKKKDYTKDARLMPATSAIIEAAAQDQGAIGYVGLGYAVEAGSKVKVLKVKKDDQSPAVAASEAAVKDGSYSIARALYLFTAGQPSELAKAFIDFCKGPEGQQIVKDAGFVTAE